MCRFCNKSGAHKEANCIRNPASRNFGKNLSQLYPTTRCGAPRRGSPKSTYTPRPVPTTTNAWSNWANGEETRVNYFKTEESYEQQKLAMEEAKKSQEPYEYTLKETFKRTGGRTVGDKLGGKRIYEEVTYSEQTIKVGGGATPAVEQEQDEVKGSNVVTPKEAPEKAPVVEKKKAVVPPHLRPKTQ
ncbi:hypothetical protein HII31_00945 [Pseudocercospora fuligena]|uniref:Uncharacterized protein n=1 Tax=Pseudocercospora fuligena TaxID=685502 RepID=A0A8H6RX79_9PEZI|nr:hypothetical protein HII31_00945 [Pseudocercospora fuligena]